MEKKSDPGSSALSRREFGRRVALAAGAGVVPAAGVLGGYAGPFNQDDPALQKLSAEGRVRFESMWQNVLRKHGARLNDEQKTRMRKIIVANVTMLETIYAVPVKNGDTPATTLLLVESAGRTP